MKFFAIALILIIFSIIYIKKKKSQVFRKDYHCTEGDFHLSGSVDNFQIVKDNRYIFTVKNGEIESVVDTQKSETPLVYKEKYNGNIQ